MKRIHCQARYGHNRLPSARFHDHSLCETNRRSAFGSAFASTRNVFSVDTPGGTALVFLALAVLGVVAQIALVFLALAVLGVVAQIAVALRCGQCAAAARAAHRSRVEVLVVVCAAPVVVVAVPRIRARVAGRVQRAVVRVDADHLLRVLQVEVFARRISKPAMAVVAM